jgi:hypothetical protein
VHSATPSFASHTTSPADRRLWPGDPYGCSPATLAATDHALLAYLAQQPAQAFDGHDSSDSSRPSPRIASAVGAVPTVGSSLVPKKMCPECGKPFKDLRAHMLLHQASRPEKCPSRSCEFHTRGFARKWDRDRHVFKHFRGLLVCGFCPAAVADGDEKTAVPSTFTRADHFKRHLVSVHGMAWPTSRTNRTRLDDASGAAPRADSVTGKCCTCTQRFGSPAQLYEHLHVCVLQRVERDLERGTDAAGADADAADTPLTSSAAGSAHATPQKEDAKAFRLGRLRSGLSQRRGAQAGLKIKPVATGVRKRR